MKDKKFKVTSDQLQKLYKGGIIKKDTYEKVKKYALGGEVEPSGVDVPARAAMPSLALKQEDVPAELAQMHALRAAEQIEAATPKPRNELSLLKPERAPTNDQPMSGGESQGEEPTFEVVPTGQPQAVQGQSQGPSNAGPSGFPLMEKAIREGMAVGAAEGAATAAYMDTAAKSLQETQDQMVKLQADQRLRFEEQQRKVQSVATEYAAMNVDSNRMFKDMSTGQKMALAIGVIFSGINGSTAGLQLVNNAIERDIEAQRNAMGAKRAQMQDQQGVLADMMKQFDDEKQALAATRLTMYQAAELRLKGQMAQLSGQKAQVEGVKALGELQMMKAKAMQDFNRATVASGAFSQADDVTKKILSLPKEIQGEAFKELGELNSINANLKQVDTIMDEAAGFTTIGAKLTSPIQSGSLAETSFARLFPIAKAIAGERMTDADARALVTPYLPKFTDSNETIQKKKQGLKQALQSMVQARTPRLSGLGIAPKPITMGPPK